MDYALDNAKIGHISGFVFRFRKPLVALLFDVDKNSLASEKVNLLDKWKKLEDKQKKVIMDTIKAFVKIE